MSMQVKLTLNAASSAQIAPGSTRRGFILTAAAAAASSTLVQYDVAHAAIVQTDTAKLPPLPLPTGIRSRYIPNINGLIFHVLEAGFESKGRPCLLLLHGYPEIAYGWRKVMLPLASAGFHVLAPDMRGYGRTTGWDDSYDGDVFPFRHVNLVRDALGLVSAFGYRTAAVVGRDAGSPVAAYCALIRPDVFQSVAMMTSPFVGPPALPFDTVVRYDTDRGNSSTCQHSQRRIGEAAAAAQTLSGVLHDARSERQHAKLPAGRPRLPARLLSL